MLIADTGAAGYLLPEELEHCRDVASRDVEYRVWDGVGQMMHATHPERFVQELHEYLSC